MNIRVDQIKRRRAIYAMREDGSTLRAIGLQYGISTTRVSQLLLMVEWDRKHYGDVTPEELIERTDAEYLERKKIRDRRA